MAKAKKRQTKRRSRRRSTKSKAVTIAVTTVVSAAQDAFVSKEYEIPLTTILAQRGLSGTFVTEILQVDVSIGTVTPTDEPVIVGIGGRDYTALSPPNNTPATMMADKVLFFTQNMGLNQAMTVDTTDDAGNGILYPGQSWFVTVTAGDPAIPVIVKVMYRVKSIAQGDLIALMTQYFVNTNV